MADKTTERAAATTCRLAAIVGLGVMGLASSVSCGAGPAPDGVVRVAVAANFMPVHDRLAAAFTAETGYRVETSVGSTGRLFAQIRNGAPYGVFLAADQAHPDRLVAEGMADSTGRITYAEGVLVLYSAAGALVDGATRLREGAYAHLAIANPDLAPYGAAAQAALEELGLWDRVQPKLVRGESIAQALHFVKSGGAELGFVALSHVIEEPESRYWVVPREWYPPLRQDAVLLRAGREHAAAQAYLGFLASPAAQAIVAASGYAPGAGGL